MPFLEGLELITQAQKQKVEEILLRRWVANYERTMSFDDFKKALGLHEEKQEDKKVEDILIDLKKTFG